MLPLSNKVRGEKMNILKILNILFKYISEAFEDYFVDYNSSDNETYINNSYKKSL